MSENVAHLQALSEVREAKARTVFAAVRSHGPVSVTDLVGLTSLSRPTVVSQLKELRRRGFLGEASEQGEGTGRPATTYHVADDCFVLGIDLLDESMALALATLDGAVAHHATATLPRLGPAESRFRAATDAVTGFLAEHQLTLGQVIGAGVCHTGTIDREGIVTRATLVPIWTGFPLLQRMQAFLGCPVVVANDLKAAAYGEFVARAEAPESLLYVKSDPGINVALVTAGQPYFGASGNAGEVADLTHVDELDSEQWLAKVAYSLALACAVTDPGLVVLNAPRETFVALSERLAEHWEGAKLSARPPRVEADQLGPAGAVVGALTLGTQHALTVALGGDGAPTPMAQGLDDLRSGLAAAGHALTIPSRGDLAEGDGAVAVFGEPGEWGQALHAESLRHAVRLQAGEADAAAGALVFEPLPGRGDRALALIERGMVVLVPWPLAEDLDRARQLVVRAAHGDGRLFACPPDRGRSRLQPLREALDDSPVGQAHAVWIDVVDRLATPPADVCAAILAEACEMLACRAVTVTARAFGQTVEIAVATSGNATLGLRWCWGPEHSTTVTLLAQEGRLVQLSDGHQTRVWCHRAGGGMDERPRPEVAETLDPARSLMAAFFELVRHGRQYDGDPARAWRAMALLEAVVDALGDHGVEHPVAQLEEPSAPY